MPKGPTRTGQPDAAKMYAQVTGNIQSRIIHFQKDAPARLKKFWTSLVKLDLKALEQYCETYSEHKDGLLFEEDGPDGWGPLHSLCFNEIIQAESEVIEVMELLLKYGADIDARASRTKETPLAIAAMYGHVKTVEFLLNHGARQDITDWQGYTTRESVQWAMKGPLAEIFRSKHLKILSLLDYAAATFVTGDSEVAVNSSDKALSERLRESGNQKFRQGRYLQAIEDYTLSLEAMEDHRAFGNRCQCYLNLAKEARASNEGITAVQDLFRSALSDGLKAIGKQSTTKAFYRIIMAEIGVGMFARAFVVLREGLDALERHHENTDILVEIASRFAAAGVPDIYDLTCSYIHDKDKCLVAGSKSQDVCTWCQSALVQGQELQGSCTNCKCPVDRKYEPVALRERFLGSCPTDRETLIKGLVCPKFLEAPGANRWFQSVDDERCFQGILVSHWKMVTDTSSVAQKSTRLVGMDALDLVLDASVAGKLLEECNPLDMLYADKFSGASFVGFKRLALAMALHSRLGSASAIRVLDTDILFDIARMSGLLRAPFRSKC